MKDRVINDILLGVSSKLDQKQLQHLRNVLNIVLADVDISESRDLPSTDVQNNLKLVRLFVACKRIDGLSKNSEMAYLRTIRSFMDFSENIPLTDVSVNTIRAYLYKLEIKGNKKTTCDNNRRNLRSFFQWLEDEGYIQKNPVRRIKRMKEPQRLKKFFSELEIEKLRDACVSKRELALVDLLISTGLRVGEISQIKVSEINWSNNSFCVIGKGDKQRRCYMNVRARKHVIEYLQERKEQGIISDYLFCPVRAPYNKELCKEEFGRIIKKIGKRCGVEDIHIHGIRAYFATNLSRKGVAPSIIQELMGHESYNTTVRYYCNIDLSDAEQAVTNCA